MRVTALAVAAALTLMVATGCADKPKHRDGTAAPAGSPSASTESAPTGTSPTESAPAETPTPSGTSSGTQTSTNTTAKCQTNQLTGDIEQYAPPGQAGSSYQARVKLTNTGNRCTMSGYLSIQLLANDQPRETNVKHSDGPNETVTLNKGDSAWTIIVWSFLPNADEDTNPPCNPRATGALVTPPGGSGSIRIAEDFGVLCKHGEIYTRPVSATRPS